MMATRDDMPLSVQIQHAVARAHGCSLEAAQQLIAKAEAPRPYTIALRTRGLLQEPVAHETAAAHEVPRPYDIALARKAQREGR